jgi:hypothetical protein
MADIFALFNTDEAAEVQGRWHKLADSEFLVARMNNDEYLKQLAALYEEHKDLIESGSEAGKKKDQEITLVLLARTILKGWKNVAYQGADLPYSEENAVKLLAVKDFRSYIQNISRDIENFRAKQEAKDLGK